MLARAQLLPGIAWKTARLVNFEDVEVERPAQETVFDRVIDGDLDAFGEIVRRYERDVYNMACRMLGNVGDAEDATQETFLRAYSNLYRYDRNRSFKTWLLSIVANYCIDVLRKRHVAWVSLESETLLPHPKLRSPEPEPETAMIKNERDAQVQDMLATLNHDERVMIILRYWYELSYQEIAEIVKTSEGTVKSRLFRARKRLALSVVMREA